MSRTYRRKGVPRSYRWTYLPELRRFCLQDSGYIASEGFSRHLERFYDDDASWGAPWSQSLKEETRRARRSDERKMEYDALMAIDPEEVDPVNLEKRYLGYVWNWD